jgi:flagellar motor switch protein FliM
MATIDTTEPVVESSGLPITPDQPIAVDHLPFRFSAADTFTAGRQESLEAWHRPFLRVAAANLRSLLRLDIDLEMDSVRVESCGEMIAGRDDQTQGLLFRMNPQPDMWLLDLPLPLALLVVERMMGGTGTSLPAADATRELTDIEQIIFQQFATTLLTDYARNWQPHTEYKPEPVRAARHLRLPRSLGYQAEHLLVRVNLRVVFKETKSLLSIALPIAVVEELLQRVGASEEARPKQTPSAFLPNNKSPIASVPVPVSILWQGFQISLREVESLAPGDLLILDNKKCENGVIFLGDRARFAGRVTRESQKTVITLTHPLE